MQATRYSHFKHGDTRVKLNSTMRTLMLGLIGIVFLASGCTSIRSSEPAQLNNDTFMSLWQTYNDCKVASNFDEAQSGLKELSYASANKNAGDFVLPLPTKLKRFVSDPANRLAVDVHAMTAACSLHAGRLALHEGHIDAARDVFASVLDLQKNVSPYYVAQAKRHLTELERGVAVSLNIP